MRQFILHLDLRGKSMFQTVNSGDCLLSGIKHSVFDVLRYLPPGVVLDVGAAAGVYTKMLSRIAPTSQIVAFEPFPGNVKIFKKECKDLPNARLVAKAVGSKKGTASFFVPSTVQKAGGGYASGYSSVGHLISDDDARKSQALEVEICRIDDEVKERVSLAKIDVQGGEYDVLEGSRNLIRGPGIDIIFLEFHGDERILKFLFASDYVVFDTSYVTMPRAHSDPPQGWYIAEKVKLSTGAFAYRGWPEEYPRSPTGLCFFLKEHSRKYGWAQTDLLCVKRSMMPAMMRALSMISGAP